MCHQNEIDPKQKIILFFPLCRIKPYSLLILCIHPDIYSMNLCNLFRYPN